MTPDDFGLLEWMSHPSLHPSAAVAAATRTRIDLDDNRYVSIVEIHPTTAHGDAEPVVTIAVDGASVARPQWSHDGRHLAVVRSTPATKTDPALNELCVLTADDTGTPGLIDDAIVVASGPEGFGDLEWSPDSTQIAFAHRVRHERYELEPKAQPARRIEHLGFQLDGEGHVSDRPNRVHVVGLDGADPIDIAPPGDYKQASWSPDGRRLVAVRDPHSLQFENELVLLDPASPGTSTIISNGGAWAHPRWAPNGASIASVGEPLNHVLPQNAHIHLFDPAAGPDQSPRSITGGVDRSWYSYTFPGVPFWWLDDSTLLASVENHGTVELHLVDINDGPGEIIVSGEQVLSGLSVAGEHIALTATTTTRPTELYIAPLVSAAEPVVVSNTSAAFCEATAPVAAERFTARNGDIEIDGWLYRPKNFDPTATYPMLLNIHGGPFTQYGDSWFDEAQLQAAAGYVVVMSNPRGSSGRTDAWGQAIVGPKHPTHAGSGWGALDYDDLMAVTDAAIEQFDFIDPNRLGVLGGSYGGYMTTWITTHSDRFAAGCTERACNNLLTLEHGSDLAGFFWAEMGPRHLDDPDEYVRMSPITYVADLNTPLLILHSEEDLRCPIEQADQLFVAAQLLGKDVEYWRFPAEGHELSRSGSPVHRRQRAEILIDFFDRKLAAGD